MSAASPLPIERRDDGIVVLHLTPNPGKPRGGVVVLDAWLIAAIDAALQSIDAMKPRGFLLVSDSERVFVAGADLAEIDALDDSALHAYLRAGSAAFRRISSLPCPSACVIHKAALGGGLELAMHCDGLIASPPAPGKDGAIRPYPIGLPEAGLCICPGWGGTNLLPARLDPDEALLRTCTGRTMTIDEAVAKGVIDLLADAPEGLIASAKAWVKANAHHAGARRDGQPSRWIGRNASRNRTTIAYTTVHDECAATDWGKACLRGVATGLEHGWQEALRVEREELNRLRAAPAGKGAITAFLNKGK